MKISSALKVAMFSACVFSCHTSMAQTDVSKVAKAPKLSETEVADLYLRYQPMPIPNGGTVVMLVDEHEEFRIPLEENPTTGYSWELANSNPKVLKTVQELYIQRPAAAGMTGAGGTKLYTFKGILDGVATLTFAYRRPWEKNVPPIKKITVIVNVRHEEDD